MHRGCPEFRTLPRRSVLSAGVLGALGLSLGDVLRLEAGEESGKKKEAPPARSVIQLHLGGGMQQQESFDPKPEAPSEIRGPFGVTKSTSGDILSDRCPETARVAGKIAILRSLVGRVPDHGLATYHLFTGYTPTAVIDYPQMGSVVSHELGERGQLPPYIAIPNKNSFSGGTGFLSSEHGPFELNADPGKRGYRVRDFSIPSGVSLERFDRRLTAREIIERRLRRLEVEPQTLETMDGFYK
ncbi:MAG: DUF1501 domain-containing protein, partial [Planctomycetota bacterium]